MDGRSSEMAQVQTIDPAEAGTAVAEVFDWGVTPTPEVDEQYRQDLADIAESEKAADRDAPLLRVF